MPRRLSRRAGPEHPVLFVDADDIPMPRTPPRPRAAEALAPFRALLAAAETARLSDLDDRRIGSTVLVGGERRAAEALLGGDALLDDGTAVLPIVIPARASRGLRSALTARFVLISGAVRAVEGALVIEPVECADLRELARDWRGRA
ncbi:hypothetical protein [Microcella sp.]|uniref:hypothetical protein n=1 Tax=Microcella sp. TaxID=1913979 RepID=UPI00391CE745